MEVITPEGTEIDVPMHDDGLHNDGVNLFLEKKETKINFYFLGS